MHVLGRQDSELSASSYDHCQECDYGAAASTPPSPSLPPYQQPPQFKPSDHQQPHNLNVHDAPPSTVTAPAAAATASTTTASDSDLDEEVRGQLGNYLTADSEADDYFDVGDPSSTEVVFVREEVAVLPSKSERIMGRLTLVKQHCVIFLAWLPYGRGSLNQDGTFDDDDSDHPGSEQLQGRGRTMYAIHPIPLSEIKAIRRHTPPLGWHHIVVVLLSGLTLPPLYFYKGGVKALISTLKQHAFLVKSADDPSTYLVNDTADPLQRSLTSLELTDILLGAPPPGASSTFYPAPHGPAAAGAGFAWMDQPDSSSSYYGQQHQQQQQQPWKGLSVQLGDTLLRVTQFAKETTSSIFAAMENWHPQQQQEQQQQHEHESSIVDRLSLEDPSSSSEQQQPLPSSSSSGCTGHCAELHLQHPLSDPLLAPLPRAEPIAIPGAGGPGCGGRGPLGDRGSSSKRLRSCEDESHHTETPTSLGSFELIDSLPADTLGMSGRRRPPQPPLSAAEWYTFFDDEGRLVQEGALRERVFYSGCEPGLRREAWKLLLGVYRPGSTSAERQADLRAKQERYAQLRQQWRSITPEQAAKNSKWRERKTRVDKDVRRTDRSVPFYAGDRNVHLRQLRQLLLTYSMYNFDLGYCQGMSDLAAPLLHAMREAPSGEQAEAEAFWCFVALMARLEGNFHHDQRGMHAQLCALRKLVQVLDPQLHAYFESRDCLNYFFCFRWLLIHFKREFSFEQVGRLWERLWACPITPHLHLYLAAAVLVQHRRAIMQQALDFDSLLRFCIELSGRLDLEQCLRLAEALARYAGSAGQEALQGLP